MKRGSISLGQIKCDDCQRLLPHPERYLAIDKEDGTTERLCVDCALKKGYARYKMERGELVLTFMEEEVGQKGEVKAEAEEKGEEKEKEEEKAEEEGEEKEAAKKEATGEEAE
jgi:hypothetical protein